MVNLRGGHIRVIKFCTKTIGRNANVLFNDSKAIRLEVKTGKTKYM